MARPSKLTPELQASMLKMLRAGVHPETACRVEGIALSTFYEWRKRGEEDEEPFAEFLFETTRAAALVLGRLEHEIVKAAQRDWRAGAFLLSRRMGGVYGDKAQVEITGANSGPVVLTDEAAELISRKILHGERDGDPPQDFRKIP